VSDVETIRWESLATIAGALALAVWALRDPASASAPAALGRLLLARLRLTQRDRKHRVVELGDGAVLGRAPDCGLSIDDATVSKHHARISVGEGAWLEDLASTNGTYVNGRRISATTVLRKGDRIALGAAKIVFLGLAPRGPAPKG
jgi:FHA domain-containing protein